MKYDQLVQLFFERSNALQWYWNIYVVAIGGLLAFSTFRQRRDLAKTILVTVLYCCFAYKNLDAINDVTVQRFATLGAIHQYLPTAAETADVARVHAGLEPTLSRAVPDFDGPFGVRNFHLFCDFLTVVAVWVMEYHRKRED